MTATALKTQGRTLIAQAKIANTFFSRFWGLMGRKELSPDEAIVFPKCNSIHTFFMRIPIDVVVLDPKGTVLSVEENMAPWRLMLPRRGASHIIEMKAFRSKELGIRAGSLLEMEGVWS
jgi:uncharacterized protein